MKSNLKPRLLRALPFIIVLGVTYFVLPLSAAVYQVSGNVYRLLPMIECCATMVVGYFYGKKAAHDPLLPIVSAVLFLPCMLVFFGKAAWIYVFIAAITCYLGQCFGAVARKR